MGPGKEPEAGGGGGAGGGTFLLFFRYVPTGPYAEGEPGRRSRANELVQSMGGTCEILRFPRAFNGFSMMSIVRGLTNAQVDELARTIDSWGAVQTTVVAAAPGGIGLRR